MITLSVIVPATDQPPTLERCRAAVAGADDPPEELIVVDRPSSLSAAEARNLGAEQATGEVVVFVDSDVEVHADAFTRIRAAFGSDKDLTAVHGSYDHSPCATGTVSVFRNLLHHHVHQSGAGPAETFWTGLGAVRRSSFQAVGGFDGERYPVPSIEDIELGDRLATAGGRLRLDPGIQGTHLKRWTLRSMLWTDFARRGAPWVALQLRTGRMTTTLNCGWRHRLSAAACSVGVVALGMRAPTVAILALVTLMGLNGAFYLLLVRQLGLVRAGLGVGLHGLHHLVSVAAVPAGAALALVTASGRADERPVAELETVGVTRTLSS